MSNASNPCEFLHWDSGFFGLRIARVNASHLSAEAAGQAIEWCRSEKIECLYFLADSDHPETTRIASRNGFDLVDIRMTLDRESAPRDSAAQPSIRMWMEPDLPRLRSLARSAHRDTRFFSDPHFETSRCMDLYETWIERSCHGFADAVFVAEQEGCPAGYITCHLKDSGRGSIGLLAVDSEWRGRSLGGQLVNRALKYFGDSGAARTSVVTQGSNVQAQRLYQRCGFQTRSVNLWYHRWFTASSENKSTARLPDIRTSER